MLLGIEQLSAGPRDSGGADDRADSDVDAAADGSGSGGAAGDSGRDATGTDMGLDVATPPADSTSDGPFDRSADVPIDASVDRGPDSSADAIVDPSLPDASLPDRASGDGAPSDGTLADMSDADGTDGGRDVGLIPDAPIGDASSDRPPTITVQGRIIDYWRHVVPAVPVTIGATTVNTDANGQFTISGVTPPYDVAFTISTTTNNNPASYGWLYKGLTRVDPTLEVWEAFPSRSTSEFSVQVTGIDFANYPSNQLTIVAHGGGDGAFSTDVSSANSLKSSTWYGPTSTNMTGHALSWLRDAADLPTSYLSYDTKAVSFTDLGTSSVSFDLTNRTVASGTISGAVTPDPMGGARRNTLYVRFSSNDSIRLARDTSQPTSFSYVVPTVTGAAITLAAEQGDLWFAPYAVAHRNDLSAGQTGIALTVPTPSSLDSPAAGATGVNASTRFEWGGSAKVYLWSMVSDTIYKSIFVVTTEKQSTIPALPGGPSLPANGSCTWYVETSGSFQSVDEATGTGGMLDAFGTGDPWGAWRGDGTFTRSQMFRFTTAP